MPKVLILRDTVAAKKDVIRGEKPSVSAEDAKILISYGHAVLHSEEAEKAFKAEEQRLAALKKAEEK